MVVLVACTDIRCHAPLSIGAEDFITGEVCDGTPLRVLTPAELNAYATPNLDTAISANNHVADEIKIALNLRMEAASSPEAAAIFGSN